MYDPWAGWRTTGTWAAHSGYSLGGIDKPLGYGFALTPPATGILHTQGQPGPGGDFVCGWVGSAGRRSILMLDKKLARVRPASTVTMNGWYKEAAGPMVALVFQHQSQFGTHGRRYVERDSRNPVGWVGASANGQNYGGDIHLHWHGLDAQGRRLNPLGFLQGSSTAGLPITPIPDEQSEDDMARNSVAWYKSGKNTYTYMGFNTESGWVHEFSNGSEAGSMPGTYTAGFQKALDAPAWTEITAGHATVIKNALAAVRNDDAKITVEIIDSAELAAYEGDSAPEVASNAEEVK